MDAYIAGQILGFVSYGLGIATFYQKNDKRLKILMLALNVNHLIHFLLLGSLTSALAAALSAVRTTAAIYTNSKIVALIFIALSLLLGGMIAENLSQLWPILGAAIGTYSLFMLQGIAMRIGFLLGAMCWLTNNIMVGSIGGVLLEATLLLTNLMTIFRLTRDGQRTAHDV
ncbi:YgjV family protein [Vibrio mediterranei]|uniref:YgjV family protein n=1 Tax=Vibrio mediterranei TaxID=689 RepID=UPI002283D436|nr:YgjV family protein [Vibrio mediterranei]MCY9851985.1 YgjV family protein [Vibrio mediterranei]